VKLARIGRSSACASALGFLRLRQRLFRSPDRAIQMALLLQNQDVL
jgi:hypothetical protein